MGEFTADYMGVAVDYRLSILIIYFSKTVLIYGSFRFRNCGVSTLFLMLNFCAVDFSISLSTLDLSSLYSEVLFTGCSCTALMFVIYFYCAVNALLSCKIELGASSLSLTEPVL